MFRHGVDLGTILSHVPVIPMAKEPTVMRPKHSNRRSSACSERPSRKWSCLGFSYPVDKLFKPPWVKLDVVIELSAPPSKHPVFIPGAR